MENMTVPHGLEKVLSIDPEIMHGDLCFSGTRVPLTVLLDNITEGMGIDEFLKHYPTVTKRQADAVVRWEHDKLRIAAGLQRVS